MLLEVRLLYSLLGYVEKARAQSIGSGSTSDRKQCAQNAGGVELQKNQRFEVYMSLLTECFRLKEIETYHFYVDIEMHVEKQNDSTLVGFK